MDFGAFVRLEEDVEGLIHISELSKKRVNQVSEVLKVGDKVTAEILNIDKLAKKIGLSIRLLESPSKEERKEKAPVKKQPKIMENFFAKALKKSINKTEDEPEK